MTDRLITVEAMLNRTVRHKPARDRFAPILNGLRRFELMAMSEDALRQELLPYGDRAGRAVCFCNAQSANRGEGPCDFFAARRDQIAASIDNPHNDQTALIREVERLYP